MSSQDPADGSGGDPQPESARDPLAHRRAEPRAFAFFWTCWLLAVTAISIGRLGGAGLRSYEIYRPSARIMLTGVFVGCAVFWPLIRLSQERPGRPLKSLLGDAIVVVAPSTVIMISQSLPGMAGWSISITAFLLAYLIAWALGLAAGISLIMNTGVSRALGMTMCLAVATVAPLVGLLTVDPGSTSEEMNPWLMASPFTVTYEVTRDRFWTGNTAVILREHVVMLGGVALAACGMLWRASIKSGESAGLPSGAT